MNIPKDPVMRLSYVNTQLRDNYSSLDDFCQSLNADKTDIVESLKRINYLYDAKLNSLRKKSLMQ